MSDILQELANTVAEIQSGVRNVMLGPELYVILARAKAEIERLRESNGKLSWYENPDRSRGQFSDWEINRRGDEFA